MHIIKHKSAGLAFPFLGEALALDLVNTEILVRGKRFEFLTTPEDAARWWREASIHHSDRDRVQGEEETTRWSPELLEALKHLRAVLRRLFIELIEQRPVPTGELEELNRVLALGYRILEMGPGSQLIPVYQTTEPRSGAILLPIALSALHLISESERNRLHKCSNDRCIALFYDTTRSATRHWCSPECMNRARSIRQYQRTKGINASPGTAQLG